MKRIELLDCTLRDGAYVVNAEFGANTIGGIIKNLQNANVDIIECGWLKDAPHKHGTSFFHVPGDIKQYMISPKSEYATYVAMIDYDRYDCRQLPMCDGETIDAIRVVFPRGKAKEGIEIVKKIREKGYRVFLQAANTLGYSDKEILELIQAVNEVKPEGLSIVDTFGAMYPSDLLRIASLINNNLDKNIKLGFHSHNNLQLSFSLSMQFVENLLAMSGRLLIVDSSLCGMGRGAGNACTELLVNYLNDSHGTDYDLNTIMDTIDVYMTQFMESGSWGYSIPYSIAGMYGCHVNNVAYLTKTHRTKSKDMRMIFESLDKNMRVQYDYDKLEAVYASYQNKKVDDSKAREGLKEIFEGKRIVTILPGKSAVQYVDVIKKYIDNNDVIVVGINSILSDYEYDWLFFGNEVKYEYAKEINEKLFRNTPKILSSNIKTLGMEDEWIVNYNDLQKRGWKYYDNSMIMFLRLMSLIRPKEIVIAGFDGYIGDDVKYAEASLQPTLAKDDVQVLHNEIAEMLEDFVTTNNKKIQFKCITKSPYQRILENE